MVKKISKRGLYTCTGNTIRDYRQNPALRQYQKYGCLVMGAQADIKKNPKAKSIMSDIHTHIPQTDSGVEFSLNKRRRWELPSYLKQKVCAEANSQHVEITVMEHTLTVPKTGGIVDMDTCNSYYNNVGPVTECVSKSEMTVESAKQGHRDQDHLSKLERRLVKKAKREDRTQTQDEADEEEEGSFLAQYEFHIAYGAPTDGNLFKELATKGFAKNIKKNRNVSGWSKRFVPLGTLDMADKFEEENYADSDIYDYEDDAAYECMHHPHEITIADFLKPTAKLNKIERRTFDQVEVEDQVASRYKEKVVYIEKHCKPIKQPTPYTPSHTQITIQQSEMEASNLILCFAENFFESACTPRIVTLDLTDKLDSEYDGSFYLVLTLQSEGQSTDTYRVYCTGTGVTSSSSQIKSLYSVSMYSLTDLVCHALSHYRELLIVHGQPHKLTAGGITRPPFDTLTWVVKSAYIEDIAKERRRKAHREVDKKNIEECVESVDDFVLVSSVNQTSSFRSSLCRSCGKDLDNRAIYCALISCRHYFCNECWCMHIRNVITEGNLPLTCPELHCGLAVETDLIMALVEYELYIKYEVYLVELSLFSSKKAKLCPNRICTRILYCGDELADRDDPIPVQCDCGTACCFRCLGEPHWPLSCSLVKPYHDRLIQSGLKDLLNLSSFRFSPVFDEERICPYCNELVDQYRCYLRWSSHSNRKYFYPSHAHQRCIYSCSTNPYPEFYNVQHPDLTEDTTLTELYRKLEDTRNVYLRDAGFHRLHNSTIGNGRRKQRCQYTKKLGALAEGNISVLGVVPSKGRIDRQIIASRKLLEHCCALNSFQAEKQFCVQLISQVNFHLSRLEAQLRTEKCGKDELQRVVQLYNNLKQQTQDLVVQMAIKLDYVKPTLVCSVGNKI